MKRVEPLLKIDTVLDYETPPPPKSVIEQLQDSFEQTIDALGGPGTVLFVSTAGCICFGVSLPGPVGAVMVLAGGVLLRFLMNHWVRSSRW